MPPREHLAQIAALHLIDNHRGAALAPTLKHASRKILLFVAATLLMLPPASAHKDRHFPIAAGGTIEGIASKFGPASITVRPRAGTTPEVTLRLGRKINRLPPCIARYFDLPKRQRMRAHGSWWHRSSRLPPYLVIELPERRRPLDVWFTGYSMMFDLRTADLLRLQRVESNQDSMRAYQVDLATLCSTSELSRLQHRKLP
jgi:hypothetical protein